MEGSLKVGGKERKRLLEAFKMTVERGDTLLGWNMVCTLWELTRYFTLG